MSLGNWKSLATHIQGDISYDLRKSFVTPVYVDIEIKAFSEKWAYFDIAFEYRPDKRYEWRDDAIIIQTTADYLKGNNLYGLSASQYGETNLIRWKYSENNLLFSEIPQIRIRFLPRVRIFNTNNSHHTISSLYGDKFADLNSLSVHNCIGIDKNGKYMCINDSSFYIMNSLQDNTYLYSYGGLSNPLFAININNGRYVVSDSGNNRLIELNFDLTSMVKNYSSPLSTFDYLDYSEENETLLITNKTLSSVVELTWSYIVYGTIIWQTGYELLNPECASYKQDDNSKIIVADTGNNRILKYDRILGTREDIYHYKLGNNDSVHDISYFYKPCKAKWMSNGNVCLVEKEGRILMFDTIEHSSSSSLSLSSSSSSS